MDKWSEAGGGEAIMPIACGEKYGLYYISNGFVQEKLRLGGQMLLMGRQLCLLAVMYKMGCIIHLRDQPCCPPLNAN